MLMLNTMFQGCTIEEVEELIELLPAAIQCGEREKAVQIVDKLAELKLKLDITVSREENEKRNREKEFSLKVQVEDRESTGYLMLTVRASDTIAHLKKKVMLRHSFPMRVQRWIVGKRICEDDNTLHFLGVRGEGHVVYLYLVTAHSVNYTQEDHDELLQRMNFMDGRLLDSRYTAERQASSRMAMTLPHPPSVPSRPEHFYPTDLSGIQDALKSSGQVEQIQTECLSHSGSLTELLLSASSAAVDNQNENAVGHGAELFLVEGSHPEQNQDVQPPALPPKQPVGWNCKMCTFLNEPTRPGCEICSCRRPDDYKIPNDYQLTDVEALRVANDQELEKLTREAQDKSIMENYNNFLATDNLDLVTNGTEFECPICFDVIEPSEGVVLRDCLHNFCKDCLIGAVEYCEEGAVTCPFQDDNYTCSTPLQEREIKALVPPNLFHKYLQRGLDQAESQTTNSYHCKSPDCRGWCVYDDQVNFFFCPICLEENCLTCKAIHANMNCKEYQDDIKARANNDVAAKQTAEMLKNLVQSGEAMHCPQCDIIVQKKDGCDWLKCSICKIEICWVTKSRRWGPGGTGDMSGGCKCRVNARKCHPNCNNCH